MTEESLAIILRVLDFSETSCVVTAFTRDFGKISALAKGARRPKSPFDAALDVLALCRIVFIRKSSDALDLLTDAKLERRFRSATRELSRLYAGYYVVELLGDLTDLGDPYPELFESAEQTLFALDGGEELSSIVLRFELTALHVLGHLPSLVQCTGCGESVSRKTGRVPFGLLTGGVLCQTCRIGKRQVVSVSIPVIEALRTFARSNDDEWQKGGLDPHLRGEVRGVLNRYMENILGHRSRIQPYLGVLGR